MYQLIGINLHRGILLLLLCFSSLLQALYFYVSFSLILPIFLKQCQKSLKCDTFNPFFLLTVITEFELYFVLLFDLVYTGGCSPHSVCNAVQSVI